MSKLTSFTSASDALIQPTGATNGQTLTWNDSTGQFEPTNPPASGLKVWATSTAYAAGELVVFAFGGVNTILRRISAGTSGLTIDAAELAAWEYVSQASTLGFIASTLIPKGFRIAVTAGNYYESTSNRTTGTIFNAGEQTNWTGLSEPECRPWVPNTFYVGGDMVFQSIFGVATYIRRISIGTSGASFDSAEAAAWGYVSQAGIPVAFLANNFVFDRFIASFNGVLYYSNGTRTTGASFDAAEQANWVALTTASTTPASNSITSAMIVNGTIQTLDIADQVVTGNKIAPGTITFNNIADGTIISSKLQNGGITAAKMGVDSVTSANIVDGTIQNEDIGAGQIALGKLAPIPTTSLVGLGVGGSPASPTNITLGTNLSFSGNVLNAAVPAPLPIFNNNQVLRGDGSNIPVTDGRITFDIAAGAVNISATGSGNLTLGSGSTGAINVGNSAKTTTLNGLVKQPGKSVFKAQRATTTQAISANLQTTVIFNASSVLGTSASPVTLDAATGIMTFTRTGTYRISGCISVQSATVNARVGLAFVPGTAVCSSTNIENNLLATANVPRGLRFEYIFTCTTVGTFSMQIGSTAALTVGFNQGTIFAPTKTNCIIEEIA